MSYIFGSQSSTIKQLEYISWHMLNTEKVKYDTAKNKKSAQNNTSSNLCPFLNLFANNKEWPIQKTVKVILCVVLPCN